MSLHIFLNQWVDYRSLSTTDESEPFRVRAMVELRPLRWTVLGDLSEKSSFKGRCTSIANNWGSVLQVFALLFSCAGSPTCHSAAMSVTNWNVFWTWWGHCFMWKNTRPNKRNALDGSLKFLLFASPCFPFIKSLICVYFRAFNRM